MTEQISVTAPKLRMLSVSEYVKALVPRELPESIDKQDNVIKQRTIIIFGRQETGKSNTARIIVEELKTVYGAKNVGVQWFEAENFQAALDSNGCR